MPSIPSLVLLPGLLCDRALWGPQIEAFGERVACQVADTTQHDNIKAIAQDVLAAAPASFALAGLSMGGYVALEIMRQAPERVERLCLLDTSARPDTAEQRKKRELLIQMSQKGQFKGVTPRLLPMLIGPDHLDNKLLTDIITTMAERVGREAFRNQQTAILNRIDSRPSLAAIRCPVQLVVGREDALTPPDAMQELAMEIPQAKLAIIEDCGHLSTLEQPEKVSKIMNNWLHT